MLKTLMFVLFVSVQTFSNSLYTDTVLDDVNLDQQQLNDSYDYSQDYTQQNQAIVNLLDSYMKSVFKLSQLTTPLSKITSESSVYSDISRLQFIIKELNKELKKASIELDSFSSFSKNFLSRLSPIGHMNEIQTEFQEIVFQFHALSPYMPILIYNNQDNLSYQIEYINRITSKLSSEILEISKVSNQLSIGQHSNQLPFQPQSPDQISFALQQQLNQSVINMVGSNSTSASSDMPFSSLASPPNADFLNMNGQSGFQQSISTPNAGPLQQMQYIPNF